MSQTIFYSSGEQKGKKKEEQDVASRCCWRKTYFLCPNKGLNFSDIQTPFINRLFCVILSHVFRQLPVTLISVFDSSFGATAESPLLIFVCAIQPTHSTGSQNKTNEKNSNRKVGASFFFLRHFIHNHHPSSSYVAFRQSLPR